MKFEDLRDGMWVIDADGYRKLVTVVGNCCFAIGHNMLVTNHELARGHISSLTPVEEKEVFKKIYENGKFVGFEGCEFRVGDRVRQTRNIHTARDGKILFQVPSQDPGRIIYRSADSNRLIVNSITLLGQYCGEVLDRRWAFEKVEPPKTVTMADVCEKFGYDVVIEKGE